MQLFDKRRGERGQSLTEMALTLPILMLLVMGIMDFGRMLFIYSQVSNAAREGARWGSVTGVVPQGTDPHFVDCDGIRQAVVSRFATVLDITDEDIKIHYDDGATQYGFNCNSGNPASSLIRQGDRIIVTVEGEFEFLTPGVSSFVPSMHVSFTAARTIMRGGNRAEPPIG